MRSELETKVQDNDICEGERPASPLIVNDLCAQIAPLDRFGLPSLGAVIADGLRSLVGAIHSTGRCAGD